MKNWKEKFGNFEELLLILLGVIILGILLFVIGSVSHNYIIGWIGFGIIMGIGLIAIWLSVSNI